MANSPGGNWHAAGWDVSQRNAVTVSGAMGKSRYPQGPRSFAKTGLDRQFRSCSQPLNWSQD